METSLLFPPDERFSIGLECAALEPGLHSVLVFDAGPVAIHAAADRLSAMLNAVTGNRVQIVVLGATDGEDALWGNMALQRDLHEPLLRWQPGRLAPSPGDDALRLVLIPDLAHLSLSATRACVMLMDAEIATLQRHGQGLTWAPNFCWLAGSARDEVGEISPHLLDRFALRLQALDRSNSDRVADVLTWAHSDTPTDASSPNPLPEGIRRRLQQAAESWPVFPRSALFYVLAHFSQGAGVSPRRQLALARLARALARREGSAVVIRDHVRSAAQLTGLESPAEARIPASQLVSEPQTRPVSPHQLRQAAPDVQNWTQEQSISSAPGVNQEITQEEPVLQADAMKVFPMSTVPSSPYPEDGAVAVREAESLRLPTGSSQTPRAGKGPIIGTQRATGLHDIALVITILEAAKYQKVRPVRPNSSSTFHFTRVDLRSYRRAAIPQRMLVLVLDYTCLQDCQWQEALLPHLSWAYVERASIYVVQVGSASAQPDLRAKTVEARNLLSPRLDGVFEEQQGTATPLAHGLDLAMQHLRQSLQHGRSRVQWVRLVVLSDGRGNVPLTASRAGTITLPVSREGVEDALRVAWSIRGVNNVESILLDPQPQQYADLPLALAEALGARVEKVALRSR